MKAEYLIGSREIAGRGRKLKLDYYLIEELRDSNGAALYGMRIKRELRMPGRVERMQESGKAISYSRTYVEQMIRLFMKNAVTPFTMLELIDEYVSREGLPA